MTNILISNVEDALERLLNRFVSGSYSIQVRDILNSADFNLKFRWRYYLNSTPNFNDIHEYLLPQNGTATSVKKIILADPGIGKSTLTYSIYLKTFDLFKSGYSRACPIHIDLSEYSGDVSFGTQAWIDSFLNVLGDKSGVKWVKRTDNNQAFEAIPFFILDSLDEYLANCTVNEIQDILNKPIFKEANIIGCRAQFYEYYISSSNKSFIKNYENFVLLPWDELYHLNYTQWFFSRFYDTQEVRIDNLIERLQNSKDLWDLCRVPIRYNMILEILARNNMNFDLVSRLISIYHNYTIMAIKHESSRNKTVLNIDEKIHCLKHLAWEFYDERKIGDDFHKIRFSRENMINLFEKDKFIRNKHSDLNGVVEDLIKGTVLIEDSNDEFEKSFISVKFNHKSLQEYFVARYIYETSIIEKSHHELSNFYRSFISQEIDQFYKDYFAKLNRDLILLDISCHNYIEAYKLNEPEHLDTNNVLLRKRIAKQQLGYNLGHFKAQKSSLFLESILNSEVDEFVKRSIVIGSAIGGHKNSLDDYVNDLAKDPSSSSNLINIGFQLSYFGDQPVNIFEPYVDQNFPKCSNTVKKLIHVINEEKNRGSWRIDLYTILYLAHHREISKQNFAETMKENLGHFQEAIELFMNDPICKNWPQTKEAIQLINTFKNQSYGQQ